MKDKKGKKPFEDDKKMVKYIDWPYASYNLSGIEDCGRKSRKKEIQRKKLRNKLPMQDAKDCVE